MRYSIKAIPRPTQRRWKRIVQHSNDRNYVRRAMALRHLAQGRSVSETARMVCAARSTVQRWRALYEQHGEAGIQPERRGRQPWTLTRQAIATVVELLERVPEDYGYLRSRWSSELLAQVLRQQYAVKMHASTLRRLLPRLGFVHRRARPILVRKDPHKNNKLRAIRYALRKQPGVETFYLDEADIDFNPRIGAAWTRRAQQATVHTPGQNQKHYLAGALHAHTGKLVWVAHERKNSLLFVKLLEALRHTYRRAHRIVLILDNYIIHKSQQTRRWLAANPKFRLVFQPVYSPWVNRIERLWKTMHDTVTRNHRCSTFAELARRITRFLEVVQPFPGNQHALALLTV